ncbi:helix-turn-helix domain-containing protein [Haloferax sp. ATB1]|uniref:MarR family transcriptional regulator n=1 Tax=Haloferax sp. ATB1 TaxID=1508454 RepID=UPI0005B1FCB7|nr:helix-turn-helix domain-containing protein [Haloferax sp. ATB1]
MSPKQRDEQSSLPSDLSVLQNKGALFILMALGSSDDGLTFTEIRDRTNLSNGTTQRQIRDRTNLSNGTTQRRLKQLHESNWVRKEAEFDDSGSAVTRYYLSEETEELWDSLKELGSTLLGS